MISFFKFKFHDYSWQCLYVSPTTQQFASMSCNFYIGPSIILCYVPNVPTHAVLPAASLSLTLEKRRFQYSKPIYYVP